MPQQQTQPFTDTDESKFKRALTELSTAIINQDNQATTLDRWKIKLSDLATLYVEPSMDDDIELLLFVDNELLEDTVDPEHHLTDETAAFNEVTEGINRILEETGVIGEDETSFTLHQNLTIQAAYSTYLHPKPE